MQGQIGQTAQQINDDKLTVEGYKNQAEGFANDASQSAGQAEEIRQKYETMSVYAQTGEAGSEAQVHYFSDDNRMLFQIPKGDKGDPGDPSVTPENIKNALGYVPADVSDVTERSRNVFYFTKEEPEKRSGVDIEYLDKSTIKINGTATSNVTVPIMGINSTTGSYTEKNIKAGTYVYYLINVDGEKREELHPYVTEVARPHGRLEDLSPLTRMSIFSCVLHPAVCSTILSCLS